jgi:hypothetical protein
MKLGLWLIWYNAVITKPQITVGGAMTAATGNSSFISKEASTSECESVFRKKGGELYIMRQV